LPGKPSGGRMRKGIDRYPHRRMPVNIIHPP
jgi:hypothetical protein